jgi:subtilisin family serine protease
MRSNRMVRSLAVCALAVAAMLAPGVPARSGEITPNLRDALLQAGPDDRVPVVVLMDEFPRQERLLREVRGLSRAGRRSHVVAMMKNLAERSQRPVRSVLAREKERAGKIRVLWGINGVALEATPDVIEQLAALPQVRWVLHDFGTPHPGTTDEPFTWLEGESGHHADGPTGGDASGPNPDADIADEIVAMGAPQVWEEMSSTGAGVIVAVVDTGLDPTHPDIADHIWTNLGEIPDNAIDDDSNGYVDDTWGWDFCTDTPPVVDSHGTQVAGQVAGDGTNGIVTGMAPDAELMSLGIDCDTPSRSWEASDYAITHGAHVITQSYSWWWSDAPDYAAFRRQADTELAAGVLHLTSAGNHGHDPVGYPIPYNVSTPANCPAPWTHPDQTLVGGVSSTIGVGNINWNTDVIDSSSSRGPSAWEDIRANTAPAYPHEMPLEYQDYPYENGAQMGLIKPDISAYGNGTTSICPGDIYCSFSGTSSATPHVTGAVALMLSINPEATPEELAEALLTTAEHRGDPGKNNVYGVGLLQAYDAVLSMGGVYYDSHAIDDSAGGNGDGAADPGETIVLEITVRNIAASAAVEGLEAILSTTTPGVTVHNQHAIFPTVPAAGTATSIAPHFSLSIDPGTCTTVMEFNLELRFGGESRRSIIAIRVGDAALTTMFEDDFEADLGWTSDPVASTQGAWVREDPIGVMDGQSRESNPEDDTSDPGITCWVTGNGELTGKKDENNNDVDGGQVILLSPPFGSPHMLTMNVSYDGWYYDVDSGNSFRAEVSNDGGANWTLLEERIFGYGGWEAKSFDLFALLQPTDDMRLRFIVDDEGADDPVEGAVDEVLIEGVFVDCQDFTPPAALAPNPVGDTLRVGFDPGGHTVLTWNAPPVDGGHDAATLYRIERAVSPGGAFTEVGSATVTRWVDVDALEAVDSFHYRVRAENAGGTE